MVVNNEGIILGVNLGSEEMISKVSQRVMCL